MAERKKIILFIVEGDTERECLGYVLSKILSSNELQFAIAEGDITAENGINQTNIPEKLVALIKRKIERFYKARDFCEVVHLVDMDGAYIPDEQLVLKTSETPVDPSDLTRLYYTDDQIFVNNILDTQRRNQRKRSIIDRLITFNYLENCLENRSI